MKRTINKKIFYLITILILVSSFVLLSSCSKKIHSIRNTKDLDYWATEKESDSDVTVHVLNILGESEDGGTYTLSEYIINDDNIKSLREVFVSDKWERDEKGVYTFYDKNEKVFIINGTGDLTKNGFTITMLVDRYHLQKEGQTKTNESGDIIYDKNGNTIKTTGRYRFFFAANKALVSK